MSLFQLQTPHEPENIALVATSLPDQEDTVLEIAAAVVNLNRPHSLQSRGEREANIISMVKKTVPNCQIFL